MINRPFGPDISYKAAKDIIVKKKQINRKPAGKAVSKKSVKERVIDYFKKKGVYDKYKKDGSLVRRIAKGVKMATKAESKPKQTVKSDISVLDIPKYIRRPGELKIMSDIDVNKDADIVNEIREVARSTGLNLAISSGHRDPDKKEYKNFSKTSPHADKSDKDRAFDISNYDYPENQPRKKLSNREKEYIAKAMREKDRRVLQEYGPLFRGKHPHLHVDKDIEKPSGYYDSSRPPGKKVIPTDLSHVKLEKDLQKNYIANMLKNILKGYIK